MNVNWLNDIKPERKKFVLSVGDEGAILVCIEGKRMLKRVFIASPRAPEFNQILALAPRAPIYVLVDVIDQAFIPQSLPPVSALNIRKLVDRKLKKDFDALDIKAAVSNGKTTGPKKGWEFLFVSIRNVPPFSEWMDVVVEKINPFAGIYLVPAESIPYIKDLKRITPNDGDGKKCSWQILVSHNRVGGFRQIVFHNNNVIFTRIAQPIGGQTPDVVAGNIEQETINTIEYIRRLGFEDEQGLEIYIIASSDVKTVLETNSFSANKICILSPLDISERLKFVSAAESHDRFGDVVFACHFISMRKHVVRLTTPYIKKLDLYRHSTTALKAGAVVIALLLSGMGTSVWFNTKAKKIELAQTQQDVNALQNQLQEQTQKIQNDFKINTATMREVSQLHTKLVKYQSKLNDIVSTYLQSTKYGTLVYNFKFSLKQSAALAPATPADPQQQENLINATMDIRFPVTNKPIDRQLEEVDFFTVDLERAFKEYRVSFTGLPKQSDIKLKNDGSEADAAMKIMMTIAGPKPATPDATASGS